MQRERFLKVRQNRPTGTNRGKDFCRRRHAAVFAIQVGERHRVNLGRGTERSLTVAAAEGEARVFGECDAEPEGPAVPHGGFDGVVGDDAGDEEVADAAFVEQVLEPCAGESAAGVFRDDEFIRPGLEAAPEVVAGLSGPIGGLRFHGVVADVKDGRAVVTPGVEQAAGREFGVAVVAGALTAPRRVIDRLLEIDENQR